MPFELIISVILIAFILQFFDASVGMSFGSMTPILILLGYDPLQVISAVILGSALLSLLTGIMHHGFENVDFLNERNFKIISVMMGFGIIAVIIGAFIAIELPERWLMLYIGLLITFIGINIFLHHKSRGFSWKRLIFFSSLASFNKGISGAGYGPVLTGGQILSGTTSKQAVGMTALSEGVVSTIGFLIYILISGKSAVNSSLIFSILLGGVLSTPFAIYTVKYFPAKILKRLIAVISILLGLATVFKVFF